MAAPKQFFRFPRWPWVVLGVWGLTPLLWFHEHLLITEDLRLPPTGEGWCRLWWAWYPWVAAGVATTLDASLGVFQAIPAICRIVSGSPIVAQQVSFVFWFSLAGWGMYGLALRVVRGGVGAALVATSFYLFNPWLDHVWSSFKPPLVAGYAVIPALLVSLLDRLERRRPWATILPAMAGLSLLGSAIGNNVSETLAMLCPIALLWGVIWIRDAIRQEPGRWRETGRTFLFAGVTMLAVNAFWWLPQVAACVSQIQSGVLTRYEALSHQWLSGISANTSFFNVIRLQGDWTWYDGFDGEPYRTYSALYHLHPAWILLGWLLPVFVVFGLLKGRGPYHPYTGVLIIVGVILSMGLHPPTGLFYGWLVDHAPFFWIVRSPYFKFMYLTCLGYALALGFAYRAVRDWATSHPGWAGVRPLCAGGLIAMNMVYAGPFVLGKMFALPSERTRLPPNHLAIPAYAHEAAAWVNAQPGFFRVYHLPAKDSYLTTWGYAGAFPILATESRKPEIFRYRPASLLFAQGATNEAEALTQVLADGLYEQSTHHWVELLRLLNVRFVLHETDLIYDFYRWPGSVQYDSPTFIREALRGQEGLARGPTFGAWEFYEVTAPLPHAYHVPVATLVISDTRDLWPLIQTPLLAVPPLVITRDASRPPFQGLLAQGAIGHLVLTSGVVPPPNLPSTIPITLVAATSQLACHVDPTTAHPVSPWLGFGPPAQGWRALHSNNAPNWTFMNPAITPVLFRVEGMVRSPGARRSLFTYLDQQLVAVTAVPENTPTLVTLDLTVPPGSHTVAWYSPDARSTAPDGQQVGFYFAQDWMAGSPAYGGSFNLPRAGRYDVTLIQGYRSAPSQPTLFLNGQAVSLVTTALGKLHTTIALTEGPCPFIIGHIADTPHILLMTPTGQPRGTHPLLTPLTPQSSTPTAHRLPTPPGPGWVVFSEAYHPGWVLTEAPQALHLKVNGFANGYWLATPPAGPLQVAFAPQRYAGMGAVLSGITLVGILGWGAGRWCRRPRPPHL